jgi:glyoxylase-like metal-dependent hydrolase (beta-lactamase superfamily II)
VDDPVAVYGESLASLNLYHPPEFKIENQLRALEFSLEDVGHVVTSHGHFDHCGGIGLFPGAKHYVGKNEINYVFWASPPGVEFFSGAPFEPIRGKNVILTGTRFTCATPWPICSWPLRLQQPAGDRLDQAAGAAAPEPECHPADHPRP